MISVPGAAAVVAVARIEAVMEAVVFGFMTRMRMTLQRFGGFHRMDSMFRAAERSYGHWHRQGIGARSVVAGDLRGTKRA
ncbi:beta-galactosidase [Streptomyces lydicamycinicus]|uniref:Beta-galactosidase n=1 Tax=Streptomyces lydicamycinicus TaxID=1546107 RepID=A0A0P4REK2_9ACTN|nr:beta-galactosidase [Streptomyces lydicamycinicus]